jgi:hypothetical protein
MGERGHRMAPKRECSLGLRRRMSTAIRWTPLVALTCLALAPGCAKPLAERRLSDGRSLHDLLSTRDTAILAVYNPERCFKCDNFMPILTQWGRDNGGRLILVLTRAPTKEETEQLAQMRVSYEGILAKPHLPLLADEAEERLSLSIGGEIVVSEPLPSSYTASPLQEYISRGIPLDRAHSVTAPATQPSRVTRDIREEGLP